MPRVKKNKPTGVKREDIYIMYDYNYYEEVKNDVEEAANEYTIKMLEPMDLDEYEEKLNDALWIDDNVTGNASGSYFFNRYDAEEALSHNWDLATEALQEFGCNNIDILEKGAEWLDVTIRCYILSSCIAEYIDENRQELEDELEKIQSIEE